MKKVLFAYAALIIVVLIFGVAKFGGGFDALMPNFKLPSVGSNSSTKVEIKGKQYNIKLAKTNEEKQKGLSEIKSLPENEGMLFIFDKKDIYRFWMKNTFIPLDIIYINDEKIVKIFENVPPQGNNQGAIPTYQSESDANYVLELNGGQSSKNGFKVGDSVKFTGIN